MVPQEAHTGPLTDSWHFQQFTVPSSSSAVTAPLPRATVYSENESPHEQDREAIGLRNSNDARIIDFW